MSNSGRHRKVDDKRSKRLNTDTGKRKAQSMLQSFGATSWFYPLIAALLYVAILLIALALLGRGPFKPQLAARVGEDSITTAQLEARYQSFILQYPDMVDAEDGGLTKDQLMMQLLNQMIDERIIAKEADLHAISVDEDQVVQYYDGLLASRPEGDPAATQLTQGTTAMALKDEIRASLMTYALLEALVPEESIDAAAIDAYLNDNPHLKDAYASGDPALDELILSEKRSQALFDLIERQRNEMPITIFFAPA